MMYGKTISCHYIPHDQVHDNTFVGSDHLPTIRQYRIKQQKRRLAYNQPRTQQQQHKRLKQLQAKELKRLKQLQSIGITLEFNGYSATDINQKSTTNNDVNYTTTHTTSSVEPAKSTTNKNKKLRSAAVPEPIVVEAVVTETTKPMKTSTQAKSSKSAAQDKPALEKIRSTKRKQRIVEV